MSADFYVHIVESPAPEELHNGLTAGKALCSFLEVAGIQYSYSRAVDLDEFHRAMTHEFDAALDQFRKPPILHLSAHGSELGIQLTNRQELFWPDLAAYMRPINEILEGGLGVCMSCCCGVAGVQMAAIIRRERLPYKWLVGSAAAVALPDVALAYSVFYRRFHYGHYDDGDLIKTVRAASHMADFDIWDGERIQEEYGARRRQASINRGRASKRDRVLRRVGAAKEQTPPTLYKQRITCNPQILAGKPTVKGTRISVELITNLLESGSTVDAIMQGYPHISEEDIEACRQYKATGAKLSHVTWEDLDAIIDGERA